MKQILVINGGNSFSSHAAYLEHLKSAPINYERLKYAPDWKSFLTKELPDYDVLLPNFPNKQNAQFEEWSIYFEKLLPLLGDDVQLVGHSLGAMFLAKYLQARPLKNKVRRLVLVAGGYNDDSKEDLGSFKINSTTNLVRSASEIHIFHSKDDPVVPFAEMLKFQTDLPEAIPHIFEDRLHFWQPDFPELFELLKQK
jgi:predicted alpha/beta hydrolase family esterase